MPARCLPPDGTLAIYLTADAIAEGRRARFERGCSLLSGHGFQLMMADNLDLNDGYNAGSASDRIEAIEKLAVSPQVDGFILGWGGKSTIDVVPRIDVARLARRRQPWMGFSDGCVLLNAITANSGLITFYGPNAVGKLNETRHHDLGLLRGDGSGSTLVFGTDSPQVWRPLRAGVASGVLIGGNLSTFTLAYLAGALQGVDRRPSILFLESGEADPRVDCQLLSALAMTPLRDRVSAVVVGDLALDPGAAAYVLEHLQDTFHRGSCSLYYCPTFGHRAVENPLIPIGAQVTIDGRPPRVDSATIVAP